MSHHIANPRVAKLTALAFLMLLALPAVFLSNKAPVEEQGQSLTTGQADPAILLEKYQEWEAAYEKNGGDHNLVLELQWSKGLSGKHTKASGIAKLDLIDGKVQVAVGGLPKDQEWDFWLVEESTEPGHTVLPEEGDKMMRIGSLKRVGEASHLEVEMGSDAFKDFRLDFAYVTEAGKSPIESRYLMGTTTLFHSLYQSAKHGKFGIIDGAEPKKEHGIFTRMLDALTPTAKAQDDTARAIIDLITTGRGVFVKEDFSGNGRTCATCHREENNFTIDPAFIASINNPLDPLFVAEFNPDLVDLEKPPLMRKLGLILENLDGFENPGVMRSVPHTLALSTSLRTILPGFSNATGWSGDGSPSGEIFSLLLGDGTKNSVQFLTTGSLRDFAIGAVRQHFTKTLNRVTGVDFRLPTLHELNSMEAFQLSLGRQRELNLQTLSLKNANAIAGQALFQNPVKRCNGCHSNAGANIATGINFNFNTGVETISPAQAIDPTAPVDGGFGGCPPGSPQPCGDGTFNTPPIVEAADTGPFFHNNAVNTSRIEDAILFYASPAFGNSPTGPAIPLSTLDVTQIGAFLRVINARENIIQATGLEQRALGFVAQASAADLLSLSIQELNDAITVLVNGNLHPVARQRLIEAILLDQQAINTANQSQRNGLIQQAICKKNAARMDMENILLPCLTTDP